MDKVYEKDGQILTVESRFAEHGTLGDVLKAYLSERIRAGEESEPTARRRDRGDMAAAAFTEEGGR